MDSLTVYSIKVDPGHLDGARKFFARQGLLLQDVLRGLIRMASRCESCLTLMEAGAPIGEIQSSLASTLADAKEMWRLNGLFQDAVLKMAEVSNVPQDFIMNVLAQAQHIETNPAEAQGDDKISNPGGNRGIRQESRINEVD